jgi:phage terminase large subunit-like protein
VQKNQKQINGKLIEFPAILPSGKPMWPEYWKLEDLLAVKASAGIGKMECTVYAKSNCRRRCNHKKRMVERLGPEDYIPALEHVIQSYDTAFLKKETADYSAITTWGVFRESEDSAEQLILLDAIKQRVEFPELEKIGKRTI